MKKHSIVALLLLWPLVAAAKVHPPAGIVVAAERQAAEAGAAMLRAGGTACDAAAATALALGVVEPASSGIGGGGFFLIRLKDGTSLFLDARETSPQAAGTGEIYQKRSSIDGPASAGVPGLLAGIDALLARCGRLARRQVAAPAIRLAREGFVVSDRLARMIRFREKAFNEAARRVFAKHEGERIVQPALAHTLARYARYGAEDFYRGKTAKLLVRDIKQAGGLLRLEDLAAYRARWRAPMRIRYRGIDILTAPLPSSGGFVLAHIFGQLARDDLSAMPEDARVHLLVEAMKRAYAERNRFLGDPDFVPVDLDRLLAPARLARLRAGIDMQRATPAARITKALASEYPNTTHFSILDREGNAVAATLSINYPFGSAWLSPATGVLLNDEMDDFSLGRPNAYGLVQGRANRPAPGKRMLSSMTPTIADDGRRMFIVGTPGGSRIISMVLLALLQFAHSSEPPQQWLARPRFHHQHMPDLIQHEKGAFSEEVATKLKARGHRLKRVRRYGNMQAVLWLRAQNKVLGLSDPRGNGAAVFAK